MKKIIESIVVIISIPLISVFLLSCFTTFIPPQSFSYISLLALAFPFILAAYLLLLIVNFFVVMKLAIIMLILLPAAYFNTVNTFAFNKKKEWNYAKDSSTLRVMTWNVQSFANYLLRKKSKTAFRTNAEEMQAIIADYNPDILCFQEYRNVENARGFSPVKQRLFDLGYKYSFSSEDVLKDIEHNNHVLLEEGVAIFSKYPILDSGRTPIAEGEKPESLIYADVQFEGKPVRVFTAHLMSFTIYSDTAQQDNSNKNIYEITYRNRRDAEYKIRETEIKHQDEVKIIRAEIDKSPFPAVYCGDLNITPTSYNYAYLRGNDLQDAFLSAGYGLGNTFYKIGPTLRIDVILASKLFEVQQSKREPRKLSDHFPVIADLSWKR